MDKPLDRTSDVYNREWQTPAFQEHHRRRIHWMCERAHGRVLDVGCSQGIVTILLAREGFEVVGIDVVPELISQAQEALAAEPPSVQAKGTFLVGDVLDPGLEVEAFDTIVAGEILEHLVQPQRLVQRCWELLRDDGTLVVTVPFGLHPHPDHKHTFYVAGVVKVLSPYFEVASIDLLHTAEGADSPAPIMGVVARKRAQPAAATWEQAEQWLAFSENALRVVETRYVSQLRNLRSRSEDQRRSLDAARAQIRELDEIKPLLERIVVATAQACDAPADLANLPHPDDDSSPDLSGRVGFLVRRLGACVEAVRARGEAERSLRAAASDRDRAIRLLRRRLGMIENATSYRLGLLIVQCLVRPWLVAVLPFRVMGMLLSAARRKLRSRRERPEPPLADLAVPLRPIPPSADAPNVPPAASTGRGSPTPAAVPRPASEPRDEEHERTRLSLSGMYEDPRCVKDLVVAAVLDGFSLDCLRPECRIRTFRPDDWEPILRRERPHFLLVESAWRGNGGSWEYRIAKYSYPGREELERLASWCRHNGIPTVFWNKEDPVHFERFIDTARLFDHIFTTDANCISKYRQELGHDRVYALPFAAQLLMHNPVRVPAYREKPVCFAGSYYRNRHPNRREELEWLLDAATDFGLEIYDRGYGQTGRGADQFAFPERFQPAIVGGVPYSQMVGKYRQYRAFLNVNSVVDSPTMFSRRVFELLACGTPVISTPALGIDELLGRDVVQTVASPEEARDALRRVLSDDALWSRLSVQGQRMVHRAHTYAHRLREVAVRLGYAVEEPTHPRVTIISWPSDAQQATHIIRQVSAQVEASPHVLLVCPSGAAVAVRSAIAASPLQSRAEVMPVADTMTESEWWAAAVAECVGEYIALLAPDDHYGPYYLIDLIRALTYTGASIVGKRSCYGVGEEGRCFDLIADEDEYSFVDSVLPAAMLAHRDVVSELGWPGERLHNLDGLVDLSRAGARTFAADRFNYLSGASELAQSVVDI